MSQTTEFRRKLGNLVIQKGRLDNIPIVMWDAIPQCDVENCPIGDTCPYQKVGRCSVRVKYLANVFEAVSSVPENMDPITVLKIGMHIIPLYSQLCRFKMVEHNSPVMLTDSKGNEKINPIFREIRETIKVCSVLLREINSEVSGLPGDGDSDYYDSLFTGASEVSTPKKRTKLKRRTE